MKYDPKTGEFDNFQTHNSNNRKSPGFAYWFFLVIFAAAAGIFGYLYFELQANHKETVRQLYELRMSRARRGSKYY